MQGKQAEEKAPAEPYAWTQTEEEVEIRVPVPAGTKAKGCKVKFDMASMSVSVAGEALLDGKLGGPVDVDESTWTISDGMLELTLAKLDNNKYQRKWDGVFK